jgi:hypothetical protein
MIKPFNDLNGSFQARWDGGLFKWRENGKKVRNINKENGK